MSRYKTKFISSYYYKGTEVLRNKKGYRDPKELQEFEIKYSYAKILELLEKPVIGFKIFHLKKIHRFLFNGVYFLPENSVQNDLKKVILNFIFLI